MVVVYIRIGGWQLATLGLGKTTWYCTSLACAGRTKLTPSHVPRQYYYCTTYTKVINHSGSYCTTAQLEVKSLWETGQMPRLEYPLASLISWNDLCTIYQLGNRTLPSHFLAWPCLAPRPSMCSVYPSLRTVEPPTYEEHTLYRDSNKALKKKKAEKQDMLVLRVS